MTSATIRVGQRVRLPWGNTTVEGTVVEFFGQGRYLRVKVHLSDDPEGNPILPLKPDEVEPIATDA